MISPAPGVAFTLAEDGDVSSDGFARRRVSKTLGVSAEWATVRQVHGSMIVEVDSPGPAGEADGLVTRRTGLPLAVFTADCMGMVISGQGGVGVAHAGWRGMADGVLARLLERMTDLGIRPRSAFAGPFIGSCCFEVGDEVAARFGDDVGTTGWDTPSVDLLAAARRQLEGLPLEDTHRCTMHDPGHHSHRASGTAARMASVGWSTGDERAGADR